MLGRACKLGLLYSTVSAVLPHSLFDSIRGRPTRCFCHDFNKRSIDTPRTINSVYYHFLPSLFVDKFAACMLRLVWHGMGNVCPLHRQNKYRYTGNFKVSEYLIHCRPTVKNIRYSTPLIYKQIISGRIVIRQMLYLIADYCITCQMNRKTSQ